jgi:fructose-bisphosphate aldolase class I
MFKFTIPTEANKYLSLYDNKAVVKIVALSGGYELDVACDLLSKNTNMIASFSRALLGGLTAQQSQEDFDAKLNETIEMIYRASI